MKFTRHAKAHWAGSGKDGKGAITTQSTVLNNTPYGFKSRFEEGPGTNPEELIGAAHAGCFTMKLSFVLNEMGFIADNIDTKADITFEDGRITASHLDVKASITGITEEQFQQAAKNAKENCPISLLLNTNISMDASLVATA